MKPWYEGDSKIKQQFKIAMAYDKNYTAVVSVNGTGGIYSQRITRMFDKVDDIHIGMVTEISYHRHPVRIIHISVVAATRIVFIAFEEVEEGE